MKTKLLLAAAISALTLGAAAAHAAPVPAPNDIATPGSGSAVEQARHYRRYWYGYYHYYPYYYYPRCYWSYGYRYCY